MLLNVLIDTVDCSRIAGDSNPAITDIQMDSRKVTDGCLFVARIGWYDDGHNYIPHALKAGAVALAVSRAEAVPEDCLVPVILVDHEDTFLANIASRFFGNPTEELTVVGITGTNGKTTVAFLISQMLQELDISHALISTVHYRVGQHAYPAPNTTPDSLVIQRLARRAVDAGARVLVMEVSSHGIALGRVQNTLFDVVGFTNLSPEHLDFHASEEDYKNTKLRLFTDAIASNAAQVSAVICMDGETGRLFAEQTVASRVIRVSGMSSTERISSTETSSATTDLRVESSSGGASERWILRTQTAESSVCVQLMGGFNRANLAVAIGAVRETVHVDWHDIFRTVPLLQSAPGRLERVAETDDSEPAIVVDYAHSSDAVDTVLQALRQSRPKAYMITVIGCGGDRDRSKRPRMARAACAWSDEVIFTEDNSRSEAFDDIIAEMTEGLEDEGHWRVIQDRAHAISQAVGIEGADVVAILGKGHEDYQEISGQRFVFRDADAARRALYARRYDCDIDEVPLLSGWDVESLAQKVDGALRGLSFNGVIRGLSTDSREVRDGDIFLAIDGEHVDGHKFVEGAVEQGAAIVIVRRGAAVPQASVTVIEVDDTQDALLKLAAALIAERREMQGRFEVIGITGSNGKTTVKEMTTAILEEASNNRVLKTQGNYNNRIGLPLSVFPLARADEYAVLEMGANHQGEIAELVSFVEPDIAALTSIGLAHTKGFGSLDGVRQAKREIFGGRRLSVAVLPQEEYDKCPEFWVSNPDVDVMTVGGENSEIYAQRIHAQSEVELAFQGEGGRSISMAVSGVPAGAHHANNLGISLACVDCALGDDALRPSESVVNRAIGRMELPEGRWREFLVGERVVIDDAYNANPTSVRAAVDTLSDHEGETWFVLGALAELAGTEQEISDVHRTLGAYAASRVSRVIGVGQYGGAIADGAADSGFRYEDNDAAFEAIVEQAPENVMIVMKGSRTSRLEEIVEALLSAWERS